MNYGVQRNGAVCAVGRVVQDFALDGTDDCVQIPDAPALRPVSVTLEAWVAFDVTSGEQVLFFKPRGAGPQFGVSYALSVGFGSLKGVAFTSALTRPFTPVRGRWYHLGYTFDADAKKQALYRDGIPVASESTNGPIAYGAQPLFLGCA